MSKTRQEGLSAEYESLLASRPAQTASTPAHHMDVSRVHKGLEADLTLVPISYGGAFPTPPRRAQWQSLQHPQSAILSRTSGGCCSIHCLNCEQLSLSKSRAPAVLTSDGTGDSSRANALSQRKRDYLSPTTCYTVEVRNANKKTKQKSQPIKSLWPHEPLEVGLFVSQFTCRMTVQQNHNTGAVQQLFLKFLKPHN